jgi:hypothetical protein
MRELGKARRGLMPKVTMSLTDRDVTNTEMLREALRSRSNAHAVSIALSLTTFLVGELRKGNQLCLQAPGGDLQKVVMAELTEVTREHA